MVGTLHQRRSTDGRDIVGRHVLSPILGLLVLLLSCFGPMRVAAQQITECRDPCTCAGTEVQRKRVSVRSVVACIATARPVTLSHVEVVGGDLNLSKLPALYLQPGSRGRVVGLLDPRAGLALDHLEQELGRLVPGPLIVSEPILIRDSTIHGGIIGPVPTRSRATPYCPLTFLQTVDLRGTTIKGAVTLPYARFRLPLVATNAIFQGEVNVRAARFWDNVVFSNATFHQRVAFREARFERGAIFTGIEMKETAAAAFGRTSFNQGAWFQSEGRTTRLRNADFSEADFKTTDAIFEAVTFEGSAKFTKARWEAGGRFGRSHFLEFAEFDEVRFGGLAAFNRTIFANGADFSRAAFEAKPAASFDGVEFRRLAAFEGVRFVGSAHFGGAKFAIARFVDAEFGGAADFRGTEFEVAEFGGERASTTLSGLGAFDFATMWRANFENTYFAGRVSFAGARFGGGPSCGSGPRVVASFAGAAFGTNVNFGGAVFLGPVNFSYTSAEPGKTQLRWRQIADWLVSESLLFVPDASCSGRREFAVGSGRPPMIRVDLLRWFEKNFRGLDLASDANEVLFLATNEETWARVWARDERPVERVVAVLKAVSYGVTSGYGVLPERVLIWLVLLSVVFWVAYVLSHRPLGSVTGEEEGVRFKIASLPWRATNEHVAPPQAWRGLAWWVSIAALLSVQFRGAHIVLEPHDRFWWVLAAERAVGFVLLALFAEALSNTVPLVTKLLAWLL